MMNSIYILGYGNPLRGDDGLGWVAAEKLRQEWQHYQEIVIDTAHQLTPEIVEDLSETQVAIFLDVMAQGVPGEIQFNEIKADHVHDSPLNHHCSPETLLQFTQQIYGHAPHLFVYSIVGCDFGYKQELSSIVEQALPNYISQINQHIVRCLKTLRVEFTH